MRPVPGDDTDPNHAATAAATERRRQKHSRSPQQPPQPPQRGAKGRLASLVSTAVRLLRWVRRFLLPLLFVRVLLWPVRSTALRVRRVRVRVRVRGGSARADRGRPLTLAQLSDLHWESRVAAAPAGKKLWKVAPELLEEAVNAVNAADPDIVVITGDFVEYHVEPDMDELAAVLGRLRCERKYASLGNHDYKCGRPDHLSRCLERAGFTVLRNACAKPFGDAEPLRLVGLGDGAGLDFRPEEVLPLRGSDACDDAFTVVLSHSPDTAWRLSQFDIDLQLSGHTHGGQVCLPLPFLLGNGRSPAVEGTVGAEEEEQDRSVPLGRLLSRLPGPLRTRLPGVRAARHWEWAKGLHRIPRRPPLVGSHWLYTNRGLASRWGLRVLCNPEVTLFTIGGDT